MIEIKAIIENEDDIGVTSTMEGRAIDLMTEGVALTESLIDDFDKHGVGTEFLFLLATMVGKQMRKRKKRDDDEGGENLA